VLITASAAPEVGHTVGHTCDCRVLTRPHRHMHEGHHTARLLERRSHAQRVHVWDAVVSFSRWDGAQTDIAGDIRSRILRQRLLALFRLLALRTLALGEADSHKEAQPIELQAHEADG
jgi:hypothetical protein